MLDTSAADDVVTEYAEPIFRFCMKRLADTYEAEDLAQEILLEVLRGLRRPSPVGFLPAWIWAVARNRYARRLHTQAIDDATVLNMHSLGGPTEQPDPSDGVIHRDQADEVFRALGSLAASYRRMLVLFYVRGLSYSAIAKAQSISVATVKWRIHYARARLKEKVEDEMESMPRVYEPIELVIACNGSMDPNKYLETQVARSIVSVAYDKPLSIEEIGARTGLPCLYIEDEMARLLHGEAMAAIGPKYATNFIITRTGDQARMADRFAPTLRGISDTLHAELAAAELAIRQIGFGGCGLPFARLLWVLISLVVREAVRAVQDSDERLSYGPYPPRRDGGKGWFIVREGRLDDYGDDSGCNTYSSHDNAIRACYYWTRRYFSRDLNKAMATWGRESEATAIRALLACDASGTGWSETEVAARFVELGILTRSEQGLDLTVPAFSRAQERELEVVLVPIWQGLVPLLRALVADLWGDLRRHTPERLHDQVNQYLAGYVHSAIGMVETDLLKQGLLEVPEVGRIHVAQLMFVYEGP